MKNTNVNCNKQPLKENVTVSSYSKKCDSSRSDAPCFEGFITAAHMVDPPAYFFISWNSELRLLKLIQLKKNRGKVNGLLSFSLRNLDTQDEHFPLLESTTGAFLPKEPGAFRTALLYQELKGSCGLLLFALPPLHESWENIQMRPMTYWGYVIYCTGKGSRYTELIKFPNTGM